MTAPRTIPPISCARISCDEPRVGVISIPNGGKANALNIGLANAPGRGGGGAGRRHPVQSRHHFAAGALVRRSRDRRGGGQCQGRQPHQHDHPLAGAGIYRGAESGAPRAVGAGHADRGAGRGGRLAARRAARAGRLSRRHPGGRSGSHHRHPDRGLSRACSIPPPSPGPKRPPPCRAWPSSASAGPMARCNACGNIAASPSIRAYGELGLVALPQVWLFQILLTTLAPVADLLLVWQLVGRMDQLYPACRHLHRRQSQDRRHLLCRLHRGGSAGGDGGLSDGKARGLAAAVVAAAAALRLSPDHVLCGAALHLDGAARALCRLGQAGAPRHGQDRAGGSARNAKLLRLRAQ